ncbi:MAG: nucleoside kinase, partial [Synergistaceae bacterium]|nr:nucleoside kinase [Synergistaceae bacterium]
MSFNVTVHLENSVESITVDTPTMGHEVLTLAGVRGSGVTVAWRVNRILRPLGWLVDEDADVE